MQKLRLSVVSRFNEQKRKSSQQPNFIERQFSTMSCVSFPSLRKRDYTNDVYGLDRQGRPNCIQRK